MTVYNAEVSKDGEIVISKEVQEKLMLKEGDKLIVKKVKGKLVIEKSQSVEDLLEQPILIRLTTKEIDDELKTLRGELDRKVESRL